MTSISIVADNPFIKDNPNYQCIICNRPLNTLDEEVITITDVLPLETTEIIAFNALGLLSNFNQLNLHDIPNRMCILCFQRTVLAHDFQKQCNEAVEKLTVYLKHKEDLKSIVEIKSETQNEEDVIVLSDVEECTVKLENTFDKEHISQHTCSNNNCKSSNSFQDVIECYKNCGLTDECDLDKDENVETNDFLVGDAQRIIHTIPQVININSETDNGENNEIEKQLITKEYKCVHKSCANGVHNKNCPYSKFCQECGKEVNDLNMHSLEHNYFDKSFVLSTFKKQKIPRENLFSCSICKVFFQSKKLFLKHNYRKHKRPNHRQFFCKNCGKMHSHEKLFTCEICGKSVGTKV